MSISDSKEENSVRVEAEENCGCSHDIFDCRLMFHLIMFALLNVHLSIKVCCNESLDKNKNI